MDRTPLEDWGGMQGRDFGKGRKEMLERCSHREGSLVNSERPIELSSGFLGVSGRLRRFLALLAMTIPWGGA